jgi:hypothetical protein
LSVRIAAKKLNFPSNGVNVGRLRQALAFSKPGTNVCKRLMQESRPAQAGYYSLILLYVAFGLEAKLQRRIVPYPS